MLTLLVLFIQKIVSNVNIGLVSILCNYNGKPRSISLKFDRKEYVAINMGQGHPKNGSSSILRTGFLRIKPVS